MCEGDKRLLYNKISNFIVKLFEGAIKNEQSIETGNIWYTRHTTKTIQKNWQHLVHKAHDEDNTEKLAIFGTQGTRRRQYRETGNI
jgi:hypothetical protein